MAIYVHIYVSNTNLSLYSHTIYFGVKGHYFGYLGADPIDLALKLSMPDEALGPRHPKSASARRFAAGFARCRVRSADPWADPKSRSTSEF